MTRKATTLMELRQNIFDDSELSKELKLFALAVIHMLETDTMREKVRTFRPESWAYRALRMMGYSGTTDELNQPLRWLISDDVPKYRVDFNQPYTCLGTMLRPAGAPCKREARMRTTIPNPMNGERTLVGACNDKRHQEQTRLQVKTAWQSWRDNGEPQPKPNSGGRLLRYFTSGIEPLYAWADKDYQNGTKVPEPPTQKLAAVISLTDRRNREDN